MRRGKTAGEDQVSSDLLKDVRQIVVEKLATRFTMCLLMVKVPLSWKSANIFLILQKGDDEELKSRQIGL